MNSKPYQEALSFAARFCSESEHCLQEVKEKLQRFELSEEELSTLFHYLKTENYLNESRYTKAYTNDKVRFARWGKQKIQFMLQRKGISSSLIGEAFECIDADVYQNNLKDLLVQKSRSVKAKTLYEHKVKLARFAQSRGFESELIWRILGSSTDYSDTPDTTYE